MHRTHPARFIGLKADCVVLASPVMLAVGCDKSKFWNAKMIRKYFTINQFPDQINQHQMTPLAILVFMGFFFCPLAWPFGFFIIGHGQASQGAFIFSVVGFTLGVLQWIFPIQSKSYQFYPVFVLGLTFGSLMVLAKTCDEPFVQFRCADAWLLIGGALASIYGWLKLSFKLITGVTHRQLGIGWLVVVMWSFWVTYVMYVCMADYVGGLINFAR